MIIWLTSVAFGSSCPLVIETRVDYRPASGDLQVAGDSGGWNKDRIGDLTPSKRAKVEQYKKAFKRYPAPVQNSLLTGQLPAGLDEVAAVIAYGEPSYVWTSDARCIGMLYGVDDGIPLAFEACEGAIVGTTQLLRTLPCARLTSGAERWRKKSRHLADYTFAQQLDILAGHKDEWMDPRALELAFGKNGELADGLGAIQAQHEEVVQVAEAKVAVDPPASAPPEKEERAQAQVRAPLPVNALTEHPVAAASWTFDVPCGSTYAIEVDVTPTAFVARASTRDPSGTLQHHTTRGTVSGGEDRVGLMGVGVVKLEPPVLTLGPWPITGCAGVEAPAR